MGNFAENLNLGNRFRPPPDPMKALCTICVNSYFIIFWILNYPFHFLAIKFIEMWFLIAGLVNQTWDQQKYCMMLFESLTMQTFI